MPKDDSLENTFRRRSNQENGEEPEYPLAAYKVTKFQNIFPCKNGENFDCQGNKSNESLDKNCKGILMFTNETSVCSCRGSNNRKRNSKNILD